MGRSNLSTKFHIDVINKFEKKFKGTYKKENGTQLNCSVLQYITLGVIQRKRLPDIEDVITLIKLGNNACEDAQAEDILSRWLENEENMERGIVGAFCELCKDLNRDININKSMNEQINNMEDTINKMQETQNTVNELLDKFKSLASNLDNKLDNAIDNKNNIVDTKSTLK